MYKMWFRYILVCKKILQQQKGIIWKFSVEYSLPVERSACMYVADDTAKQ